MDEQAVHSCRDLEDVKGLSAALKSELGGTDVILFKASRAVRLERVIDDLKETGNAVDNRP